jgi:hypothetical protein
MTTTLDTKKQIDLAKLRIENGEKSYQQMVKQNAEKLKAAEEAFNKNLSLVAGKKVNYQDATFNEDSIEI